MGRFTAYHLNQTILRAEDEPNIDFKSKESAKNGV
jgi:hypothetical protein